MQYKTKAEQIAHGVIQSYIGPEHKVIDMFRFCASHLVARKSLGT